MTAPLPAPTSYQLAVYRTGAEGPGLYVLGRPMIPVDATQPPSNGLGRSPLGRGPLGR